MKRCAAILIALLLLLGLSIPASAGQTQEGEIDLFVALLTEAIRERKPEVDLSGMGFSSKLAATAQKRLCDDPELFYFKDFTIRSSGEGRQLRIEIHYYEDIMQTELEEFESAVARALDCVLPGMDALQTALVLHDYLVEYVEYDYENYIKHTIPHASRTAYGALALGRAVCNGYAQAYRLLLGRCGIEAVYLYSEEMDHGWTMVHLGENWYHVDPTWDDPVSSISGTVRHSYFLLSDAAISDEEHKHYGWTADHACSDPTYDTDAFWHGQNFAIPFTSASTCWVLQERGDYTAQTIDLVCLDQAAGASEAVASVQSFWPAWDKPGWYWNDAFSGLVYWDGRLFFNDSLHVYGYDPAAGTLETVYTYAGGDGYLYGLSSADDTIRCIVRQHPNEGEEILLDLPIPRKQPTGPFADVSQTSYYYNAVLWATERNVTSGTGEGKFSPEAACSRGQAATFLWRVMGRPAPKSDENPFADVPEDAYYRDAVLWAVEQGITNGTGTDQATGKPCFSPDADCSYAHILTFLWRCLTGSGMSSNGLWYTDAMNWAMERGLLQDTVLAADAQRVMEYCPRGDAVTFLWRALSDSIR